MKKYEIRTAASGEEQEIIALLTAAFVSDPAARWLYSNPRAYFEYFPDFIRAFGGGAFKHRTAHMTEGSIGAALWFPPGVSPDESALDVLFHRSVPQPNRDALPAIFEQMAAHHPPQPHWYLPMLGVDPLHQGRGCGSALLSHALAELDKGQQLAYLESSNPANIPLYERHGFQLIAEIRVGSCPPIFPMVRPSKVEQPRLDARAGQRTRQDEAVRV